MAYWCTQKLREKYGWISPRNLVYTESWLANYYFLTGFHSMSSSSCSSESGGTSQSENIMVVDESSDDDDDFMVAMVALDWMASGNLHRKTIHNSSLPVMTGLQWVEVTLQNPVDCYDMFRMRRSVFLRLHDTLVQNYGLRSSRRYCSKEALGMFLWACGAHQSFRQCRNKFRRSLETVSRKFTEVLESIVRLAFDIVRPKDPQFGTIHPKLQEARFWPHFEDCIDAIDGTHIPITVPLSDQPKYISRHGYASQNVMAVCDFDMRFIFVVTGWPGSVHDTRVLLDTLLTCKDQFPHPSDGKNKLPKKKKDGKNKLCCNLCFDQ